MRRTVRITLRLLATLTLILSGSLSIGATVGAASTAQEAAAGGLWSMGIGARTTDAQGNVDHTVGARFTVTSEDGDFVGECTLPEPPQTGVAWWNCRVDVPSDRISLIWEDLDSIPAGYAPVENPMIFDPATYETGPHNIGAFFDNVPVDGSTSTSAESSASTNTTTSNSATMPFTIGAHNCSNVTYACPSAIGAHFTVTTEDGQYLDECTLADTGSPRGSRCSVDVPLGIVVIVTEDVDTIDPAYAPESNPIRFDTSVAPQPCEGCDWGPTFTNGIARSDNAATDDLVMWARSCDDSGSCKDAIGAQFTVTTESGEYLGECTLESVVAHPAQCSVSVPIGGVVIVTEDVSTLPAGLAPESNPISIDTAVEPFTACAPCAWGPIFRNGPTAPFTSSDAGFATSSTAGSSDTGKTWTASVQVNICDAPPGNGSAMNCSAGAGVTVNISLASGELIGSCTTGDPQPTPWGVEISTCSVEGMPFNADMVAVQDPATIPEGYAPFEETLSLHVENLIPGGGDQATFTFINVRTSAPSGSTNTSGNTSSGSATLLMTFRGCPEGFDPNAGDFFAECTIPLDAPDASFLYHGGDGQGGINIAWLDRREDGAYIFAAGPQTMLLQLSGLAPVLRDGYQVFGADGANGETYTVSMVDGEVREVYVFYYYEP